MRNIPLTQGKVAIVDDEDYNLVVQHTWQAQRDGRTWYALSGRRGKPVLIMHRLIYYPPDGMLVDHIDRNGLNNVRSNLRWVTRAQNALNTSLSVPSSGYRGVTLHKNGRWQVMIQNNGKARYIGLFDTPEEGARAYDAAAMQHHGDFALLNFPLDELI